ncbi:hypothetical protein ACLB2K_004678 [Fragaria x ananassa]
MRESWRELVVLGGRECGVNKRGKERVRLAVAVLVVEEMERGKREQNKKKNRAMSENQMDGLESQMEELEKERDREGEVGRAFARNPSVAASYGLHPGRPSLPPQPLPSRYGLAADHLHLSGASCAAILAVTIFTLGLRLR